VKSADSVQKWIKAGYEILAREGPESIQIERLARELGLNKSGFYHYFGDQDIFFSSLMEHHFVLNGKFYEETMLLKQFNPDYFHLLIRYKTTLGVQAQLRKQMSNPIYNEEFIRIKKRNDKAVLPLWASYLNIPDNPVLAQELWEIMRDVFYMRLNIDNLTFDFIQTLVYKFGKVVDSLLNYKTTTK
jgi:AcrR family transcriptional regulator